MKGFRDGRLRSTWSSEVSRRVFGKGLWTGRCRPRSFCAKACFTFFSKQTRHPVFIGAPPLLFLWAPSFFMEVEDGVVLFSPGRGWLPGRSPSLMGAPLPDAPRCRGPHPENTARTTMTKGQCPLQFAKRRACRKAYRSAVRKEIPPEARGLLNWGLTTAKTKGISKTRWCKVVPKQSSS